MVGIDVTVAGDQNRKLLKHVSQSAAGDANEAEMKFLFYYGLRAANKVSPVPMGWDVHRAVRASGQQRKIFFERYPKLLVQSNEEIQARITQS